MRTYVLIEVTHKHAIPGLATDCRNRIYNKPGVEDAEVVSVSQDKLEALANSARSVPTAGDQADAYDGFLGFAA